MIRNSIKTAFRNLKMNKGFTLINILGLALGLSACLLIIFYVIDEFGYDRYNKKADRIFRVNTDGKFGPAATPFAIAAPAVAGALMTDFPEVQATVRLLPEKFRVKKGNEIVREDQMLYADPTVFEIFTLPMAEGDPKTSLNDPNSVVLTESMARKYFNSTHVIGKSLNFIAEDNTSAVHTISGVIRDIPPQSHFRSDFFLPMAAQPNSRNTNFFALYPFNTYVLLKAGADYKNLQAKFPAFMRKYIPDYDAFEKSGSYLRLSLIPLTAIHLQSNRTNELGRNGNEQYNYIFLAVAFFILLIACINFMNLSTARSANRAREVGVRKVLGSRRNSLIAQFLAESILVTLIATILAMASAWLLLPLSNPWMS